MNLKIIPFLPLLKFKIEENSMSPFLKFGDLALILRTKNVKEGEIVVFRRVQEYYIKRVVKIENDKCFLKGDNRKESIDSRKFGWIDKKDIIGKMIYKIATNR